jgi:hypothetical protein
MSSETWESIEALGRYRVAQWVFGRHKLRVIATTGILLSVSCSSPSSPSDNRFSLSNADNGRVVSVKIGDEIDVTLQTIGPGEYDQHPDISSRSINLLSVSYVSPPNPAGPRQLFQFKAVAPGQAAMTIFNTGQNLVFRITVDVR